jgi:hypothetical protein
MGSLHREVVRIVSRNIGAPKRHDDWSTANIQKWEQRAGRQGEEDVHGVIPVRAKKPAHHWKRTHEIAGGSQHPCLMHSGAAAPDSIKGKPKFLLPDGAATLGATRQTAGHHIHRYATSGESPGECSSRDAGSASQGRVLVVQHQDAHLGGGSMGQRANPCQATPSAQTAGCQFSRGVEGMLRTLRGKR